MLGSLHNDVENDYKGRRKGTKRLSLDVVKGELVSLI